MVEYTAINYLLAAASAVVFTGMLMGCVVLVARERTRKKRKRDREQLQKQDLQRHLVTSERLRPESGFTSTSGSVSLRGINEWHILPPIKNNFRNYTSDGHKFVGNSRTTDA